MKADILEYKVPGTGLVQSRNPVQRALDRID